jgi:hypothetical protein
MIASNIVPQHTRDDESYEACGLSIQNGTITQLRIFTTNSIFHRTIDRWE